VGYLYLLVKYVCVYVDDELRQVSPAQAPLLRHCRPQQLPVSSHYYHQRTDSTDTASLHCSHHHPQQLQQQQQQQVGSSEDDDDDDDDATLGRCRLRRADTSAPARPSDSGRRPGVRDDDADVIGDVTAATLPTWRRGGDVTGDVTAAPPTWRRRSDVDASRCDSVAVCDSACDSDVGSKCQQRTSRSASS